MASHVPPLALSHGQVLWCLAGGKPPTPPMPSQMRYLRVHGIPFADAEQGGGRGIRVTYNFYQFIEVGVAYEALRQRIPPRLLEQLATDRTKFRNAYRHAYGELVASGETFEDEPFTRTWYDPDFFIRLRDQYSQEAGTITMASAENNRHYRFGDLIETTQDGQRLVVIPLKSVMLSLLKLAKIAPATRPGPKG